MKKVAALMRDHEIPFALAGSMAIWARGGPDVYHDIDFVVLENDKDRVLHVMRDAGLRTEKPEPEWLYKAWDGDNLVDFIFRPPTMSTALLIENAEALNVQSVSMPVLTVDDVMIMKLAAMTELYMDYSYVLQMSRSVREQMNWEYIERMTKENLFAEAFFLLAKGLGIRA